MDGGELNGGGNGRGVRFANRATPVSNRKGSLGSAASEALLVDGEANRLSESGRQPRHGQPSERSRTRDNGRDLVVAARDEEYDGRIPTMSADSGSVSCCPQLCASWESA